MFEKLREYAVVKLSESFHQQQTIYWDRYLKYLDWIEKDYDDLEWFVNGLVEWRNGPEHDALLDAMEVYIHANQ